MGSRHNQISVNGADQGDELCSNLTCQLERIETTIPVKTNLYFFALLMLCRSWTAGAADGALVYEQNCMSCHGEGVSGAPRLGEVEAWQEHLSKGIDAMVTIVVEGVQGYSGEMPSRGGNPNLGDGQIREAVQYMLDHLQ